MNVKKSVTYASIIGGTITGTTLSGLTFTAAAAGFTIAGGTTSKTLTVALDSNVAGTNTGDVTLATNHGLALTNQVIGMGTPTTVTGATTSAVTTTTHSHALDLTATPIAGSFTTLQFSTSMQLQENAPIILDAALSADGQYSGITEAGTAGAALAFGEIVYLAVADSRWELAKANAAATSFGKIGICVLAAGADGNPTTVLLYGKVRADAKFPTMTIGAPVFISAATAGLITSTAPSGTTNFVVRIIGQANTGDELFFCPSPDYIELA